MDYKGCLIENHTNTYIALTCLDQNCQKESRTICQQCLLDEPNSHKECQVFLEFSGPLNDELKIHHKNQQNIQNIYTEIIQYEKENCALIDQEFDSLTQSLVKKIIEAKKTLKKSILSTYSTLKTQIESHLDSLKSLENLSTLSEEIKNFKEKEIKITELNEFLTEKRDENNENFSLDFPKNLQQEYNQIIKNPLKKDQFQNLEDQFSKILDQILPKTPSNQLQFIHYEDNSQYWTTNEQGVIMAQGGCCNLKTVKAFNKDETVQVKFQLRFPYGNGFNIGIIPRYSDNDDENNKYLDWSKVENFMGLQNDYYQKSCVQKKGNFQSVFENGQIYELEICYKDNLFRINDINCECIVENEYQFNQEYDSWYLFIQMHNGLQFSLL